MALFLKGEDVGGGHKCDKPCAAVADRSIVVPPPPIVKDGICNPLSANPPLGVPSTWPLVPPVQRQCFTWLSGIKQHEAHGPRHFVSKAEEDLGRNWCWVGFKEFGCHRQWSDHLTWYEMQKLAVKQNVTSSLEFRPLQAPEICDHRVNGGMRSWNDSDWARAKSWYRRNVATYVVSLPQSAERRQMVTSCLRNLSIEFAFSDGIDVRTPGALQEAQREGLIPESFNFERAQANAYSARQNMGSAGSIVGTVGCAAAHFRVQRAELRKSARKPIAAVFEDDVCPEKDFVPRLWSFVTRELPCDWEVVSLYSRCPFGRCILPHLSRVQPDVNEPEWRCHHGVNSGFQGMLYKTSEVERVQEIWQPAVFDEERPLCLYVDNALAAISDRVNFYAVPSSQSPGFLRELDFGSVRIDMNKNLAMESAYHSCASYGCDNSYHPENGCQCNSDCKAHGNCCVDYTVQCRSGVPKLYCFALMLSWTYELPLLQSQAAAGVGMFGCRAHTVFSDKVLSLRSEVPRPGREPLPAIVSSVVEGPLTCKIGGWYHSALNTAVFAKVWRKVFERGHFRTHDWTVKVDPDSVFLPGRLIEHLRPGEDQPRLGEEPTYFNNCGYGLHGPIEILSRKAALRLSEGGLRLCEDERVTDWGQTGEDVFLVACLKRLGVAKVNDFGLLSETNCGEQPSPCVSGKVAFHPFKGVGPWFECLKQARR